MIPALTPPSHSRRARLAPHTLARASAILLALIPPPARSAPDPKTTAPAPETVLVPYDPASDPRAQSPDRFAVAQDDFDRLWDLVKQRRRERFSPPDPAISYALMGARYEATLAGDHVDLSAKIDLRTFGRDWVEIPIAFDGARLTEILIDDQPAAPVSGSLAVARPGHHTIRAKMVVPVTEADPRFSLKIPETEGCIFQLHLPNPHLRATIPDAQTIIERADTGGRTITAAIPRGHPIDVAIGEGASLALLDKPSSVEILSSLAIAPGLETVDATFTFHLDAARLDRFALDLDPSIHLAELDAIDVRSWKLVRSDRSQRLELELATPARDSYQLRLRAERTAQPGDAPRAYPIIGAPCRLDHSLAILASPDLQVQTMPPPELRRAPAPPRAPGNDALAHVASYRGPSDGGALRYVVAPKRSSRVATIDALHNVERSRIESFFSLDLRSPDDTMSDLAVALPADTAVERVQGDSIRDWWIRERSLKIRLRDSHTTRATILVSTLRTLDPASRSKTQILPLKIDGFDKVSGQVLFAAHRSTGIQLDHGAQAPVTREIDPLKALPQFEVLPPLERKRAFAYREPSFAVGLTLTELPARFSAAWVMLAQAREDLVHLQARTLLTVDQGALQHALVRLPKDLPEARVSGDDIRETTVTADESHRIYRLEFQRPILDATTVALELDLPHPGTVDLPRPEFPDPITVEGFVVAENLSDAEMKTQVRGLTPCQASQLPFLPPTRRAAGIFRAGDDWALSLAISRLEKTGGRAAFVPWADLSTSLLRNGHRWHRATYRIQNRSLQFLPLRLPPGTELVGARVAGGNVRVDLGEIDGTRAHLIPLIRTRPGDLSYDIEIVYRDTAPRTLARIAPIKLADPQLVGITVERTFWQVQLPHGYRLQSHSGNLQPALDDLNRLDQLSDQLKELQDLNSAAIDSNNDADTQRLATSNSGRLSYILRKAIQGVASTRSKGDRRKFANIAGDQYEYQSRSVDEQLEHLQRSIAQQTDALAQLKRSQIAATAPQSVAQAQTEWLLNRPQNQIAAGKPDARPEGARAKIALNDAIHFGFLTEEEVAQPQKPQGAPEGKATRDTVLGRALVRQEADRQLNELAKQQVAIDKNGAGTLTVGGALEYGGGRRLETRQAGDADKSTTNAPAIAGVAGGGFAIPSFTAVVPKEVATAIAATPSQPATTIPQPAATTPKPVSRAALALEIPVEGAPLHWKKLKANAQLDLLLVREDTLSKWPWYAAFAPLALALALIGRRRRHP